MPYRAFISYSHAADGKLAPALQAALQRFAKPWYRRRALEVFRDQTSLAVTPALWPAIQKALSDSEFFILMASPEAAASHWVRQEIDYWLKQAAADKILIVLTEGEIVWDDEGGDFDWGRTTALPETLKKTFPQEPLYLDLRWAKQEEDLSLSHPKFRDAVAELAAPLHGRPKDDISGEDVRQHRRTRRILWSGLIAISTLAVAFAVAFVIAFYQYRLADERGKIALSRQLAAQANFLLAEHPLMVERSVLLALESLKREITPEGGRALSRGLSLLTRRLARVSQEGKVEAVLYSPDGRFLASISPDAKLVIVRDSATGAEVARLVHPDEVGGGAHRVAVAFSPDGRLLATGCKDGYARLWDPATGREVRALDHGGHDFSDGSGKTRHSVNHVAFSPDGARLATAASFNGGRVWEVDTGRELYSLAWEKGTSPFSGYMTGVKFSPDNRYLAVVFLKGEVLLREAADGKVATWVDGGDIPDAMAFSPDSRWLAVGLRHGRTLLLDIADNYRVAWLDHSPPRDTTPPGAPRKFINYGSNVNSIAFSPDNRWLATGYGDGQVRLWKVADGRELKRLQHDGTIMQVCFSPDGGLLAVADYHPAARVYETARWREVARLIHGQGVMTVASHPQGQGLATGDESGQVQLWAAPSHFQEEARLSVGPNADAQKVCFSPDGRWLAAAFVRYKPHHPQALVWDVRAGREVARLQPPRGLAALTFSPDSRYLAMGSVFNPSGDQLYNPSQDWLVTRSEPDRDRKSSGVNGSSATEAPADSQQPAAPASVLILETGSLREVTRLRVPQGRTVNIDNRVKFSPDSRVLATWKPYDNTARLWEAASGRELLRLVHDQDQDKGIQTLAFSPDGRLVATGSDDNTAHLWEVQSGRELHRLKFKYPPSQVGFSPHGRWLVSHHGEIHLLDPATGKETGRMPGYGIDAFNPQGNWLVTGRKGHAAYVVEVDSGQEISQFRQLGGFSAAAFSPDGRWVASGDSKDASGAVHIWEAATGQEWCRVYHDYGIRSLAFSPDGRLLASASLDGTVRLWRWQPEDLMQQACSRLTRNLTKAEWQQYLPGESPRKTCPDLPGPED